MNFNHPVLHIPVTTPSPLTHAPPPPPLPLLSLEPNTINNPGGYDALSVYTIVVATGGTVFSSSGSESVPVSAVTAYSSASGSGSTPGDALSFYDNLTSADGGEYRHMGCYVDERSARIMRGDSTSSGNMIPARCNAFCSDRGHNVFNLQYGTE